MVSWTVLLTENHTTVIIVVPIDLIHLSAATSVKFITDPDEEWKKIYKDAEFNEISLHFYFILSYFSLSV
jgi:hypothetical protein